MEPRENPAKGKAIKLSRPDKIIGATTMSREARRTYIRMMVETQAYEMGNRRARSRSDKPKDL